MRKDVSVVFDVFVGLFDRVVFKGRFAEQQSVHDDSYRPNVDLVGVALFFQNLRSDVVGCTADGFLGVAFVFDFGGESKITNFSVHLIVNKNVAQLEIAVYYALRVNIDHGFNDLPDVYSSLKFSESFPSLG